MLFLSSIQIISMPGAHRNPVFIVKDTARYLISQITVCYTKTCKHSAEINTGVTFFAPKHCSILKMLLHNNSQQEVWTVTTKDPSARITCGLLSLGMFTKKTHKHHLLLHILPLFVLSSLDS